MNEQTRQLMLMDNDGQPEAAPALPEQETERIKSRMRALTDLKKHPGFAILKEALSVEAQATLTQMDRADNSTKMIQYSANYFSLTMAAGYVDNELARLRALLGAEL